MERYNRNISITDIGEEGQKKLLNSKVLICGCGGLGSTVIANLSSLGIGTLGIIDDDIVELSNLNRQYIHKYENINRTKVLSAKEWINSYNPDIEVCEYNLRLDENNYNEIVKDYDLIVDCFDSFGSKFLLNDIAVKSGKILIHGGITEFYGQVSVIVPQKTPCLRCILPDTDNGSYVSKGVVSPAVSLIASVESMEVLKMLLDFGSPLTNSLLTINCLSNEFKKLKITKNTQCKICS